jgi:hypothetical protein
MSDLPALRISEGWCPHPGHGKMPGSVNGWGVCGPCAGWWSATYQPRSRILWFRASTTVGNQGASAFEHACFDHTDDADLPAVIDVITRMAHIRLNDMVATGPPVGT